MLGCGRGRRVKLVDNQALDETVGVIFPKFPFLSYFFTMRD